MAQMDEGTLKAILRAEKAAAMGGQVSSESTSDLAKQRASAMDYYLGDMTDDMPTIEGRSSAVSTDVADTVDGMMPSLMDIFTGSDEVVRFDPVGEEDEEAAQQETDFVNHVFYVDNEGFIVLHTMVKDALVQKNGIVKFWWDEGEDEERETYEALPDDAYALLTADDSVEIIEHTERPALLSPNGAGIGVAPGLQDVPTQTVHDVVAICRKPYGRVRVEPVPPEEFLIAKDARNIRNARYCAHRVTRTQSELIEQGYDRTKVEGLPTGNIVPTTESTSRATVNDNDDKTVGDVNKAMRPIDVTEHYIRVDYDGDGIAEIRKVTTAGSGEEILDNEPCDRMPFAGMTPILMSHRFWGRSVADLVMDIQKIKTALIRAVLDNAYFANNNRMEVAESHAGDHTLDDLLTNRPGGIIRTRQPGGIIPIPTNPIGQHLFPVIEYMDGVREVRTGVQRQAPGPDADTINPFHQTATGVVTLASAAQQRIRLVARIFAETGIKDLCRGIHELLLKHGTEARKVKLRNKWVTVDPRQWKTRKDMTVTVGLGTGTRDQVQAYLMQILGLQAKAVEFQGGTAGPLVKMSNIYNTVKKLTENAGFRSADPFWSEPGPEADQPKPPAPDPKMIEAQGKLQIQGQQMQANVAMQRQQMGNDLLMQQQQAQSDAQIEVFKAQLKAQTDTAIAEMKARLEAQVALLRPDENNRPGGAVDR